MALAETKYKAVTDQPRPRRLGRTAHHRADQPARQDRRGHRRRHSRHRQTHCRDDRRYRGRRLSPAAAGKRDGLRGRRLRRHRPMRRLSAQAHPDRQPDAGWPVRSARAVHHRGHLRLGREGREHPICRRLGGADRCGRCLHGASASSSAAGSHSRGRWRRFHQPDRLDRARHGPRGRHLLQRRPTHHRSGRAQRAALHGLRDHADRHHPLHRHRRRHRPADGSARQQHRRPAGDLGSSAACRSCRPSSGRARSSPR